MHPAAPLPYPAFARASRGRQRVGGGRLARDSDQLQASLLRHPGAALSLHADAAEAYFNKVSAPKKRLIIIEDAGLFALATHQADVIAALKAAISPTPAGVPQPDRPVRRAALATGNQVRLGRS